MPGTSKRSYQRKLNRAREHLKTLRVVMPGWAKPNNQAFVYHVNQKTGEIRITLRHLPEELPVLIGDFLQNLRSSLDHLIYELVVAYNGASVDPDLLEQCQFPIGRKDDVSADEYQRRIGAIHPEAQAVIKGLEPERLRLLNELARIDRHRSIHAGGYVRQQSMGISGDNVYVERMQVWPGVTEPGAVVAEYIIRPADPKRRMHMSYTLTADIVFVDGPCKGDDPIRVLTDLQSHVVNDVIPLLVPFLDRPRGRPSPGQGS